MKFTANMLLTCIVYCDAGPGCFIELFASTVCRFLSRISFVLVRFSSETPYIFTSRKLYLCLETFLCFLSSMYRFIPPFVRSSTT